MAALVLVPGSAFGAQAAAQDTQCAVVRIEIEQELTLERQAFDAMLRVHNRLEAIPLREVEVTVSFTDGDGNAVRATSDPTDTEAAFFIREAGLEGVDDVSGTGVIAAATHAEVHWLIIPTPGAGGTLASGRPYRVGATLSYVQGGVEERIEVAPDTIVVKPLPRLSLDYFLTRQVEADDPNTVPIEPPQPFTLGVRVSNNGQAAARGVRIDSAQPRIIENDQGLLAEFLITESYVGDRPASPTLLLDFGEIPGGGIRMGRWRLVTNLAGEFVDFTARISHSDELGGQATSILEAARTHDLIRDVLVDLPGRDAIHDFLAKDDSVLRVYESDSGETVVVDRSGSARLEPAGSGPGLASYRFEMRPAAGFAYARHPDPFAGTKAIEAVVRADGKRLAAANAWTSSERGAGGERTHWLHLFDANTGGEYTVVFGDALQAPAPPVLQAILDRVTHEGRQVSYLLQASDPNGTVPALYAEGLPPGALFADQGDGTAVFDWTPAAGQAGRYEIAFGATDGDLAAVRKGFVTVHPASDTDGDGMDDDWERERFGTLDRDGRGDLDGDGVSDLAEHDGGSDPLRPEAGSARLYASVAAAASQWQRLDFPRDYDDPVLILGAPTSYEVEPGVPRARALTAGGVELRFQEWAYLDQAHRWERLPFLVAEAGRHTMADGSVWELGTFPLAGNETWQRRGFALPFPGEPALFLTVQTYHGGAPVMVRARSVDAAGFEAALFEEEQAMASGHLEERVGYLAIHGTGGTVASAGAMRPYTLERIALDHTPALAGDRPLRLEEETSMDAETVHAAESVALLRLDGELFAQDISARDADTATVRELSPEDGDGDGMADGEEWAAGFDPRDPSDGATDADGDGHPNRAELAAATDPRDPHRYPAPLAASAGELLVDHRWRRVELAHPYVDPVVLAGVATDYEPSPGVVQLRGVAGDGFQIRFTEWSHQDGWHDREAVPYAVLESGRHELPGGRIVEVGRTFLNGTGQWRTRRFHRPFPEPPRVFLTAQTTMIDDPITVRVRDVTAGGFQAALFEQESRMGSGHPYERIGYVAVYGAGGGRLSGASGELGYWTGAVLAGDVPVEAGGATLWLEEETSRDAERAHLAEDLSVLTLAGLPFAQDGSARDKDTAVPRRRGLEDADRDGLPDRFEVAWGMDPRSMADADEDTDGDGHDNHTEYRAGTDLADAASYPTPFAPFAGRILIAGDWRHVALPAWLSDPVVIAGVPSDRDPEPGVVRLREVSAGGFEVRFQEWAYLDRYHAEEALPLLVLDRGRYARPDGALWEVGRFELEGTGLWRRQAFRGPFPEAPALILSVQTFRGGTPVTVRARRVGASGFEAALFEEEALMQTGHLPEQVGYLAVHIPGGNGLVELDGVQVPIQATAAMLGSAPEAIEGAELWLEEEASADEELAHGAERLSVVAIDGRVFVQDIGAAEADTAAPRRRAVIDGDGDGLPDRYEIARGLDARDADNAWRDGDGDGHSDHAEYLAASDPNDPASAPASLDPRLGTARTGNHWAPIALAGGGPRPVIITGVPTSEDPEPGVVRLRWVEGGAGLQVRFQEWSYLDRRHAPEDIPYLVLTPGRHTMPDGSIWEVGHAGAEGNGLWRGHRFRAPFPERPSLFLTIQTYVGGAPAMVRARRVTASGFEAALFEEEAAMPGGHLPERVGYLAIHAPGAEGWVSLGGRQVRYVLEEREIGQEPVTVSGARLRLEEEGSLDAEVMHAPERVMVLGIGGRVFAQDVSAMEADTAVPRRVD